jgi:hypothetical protein
LADNGFAPWDAVLDDLDARVTAAEHGDLAALAGWAPPVPEGVLIVADTGRATRILTRQRDLLARLRDEQTRTAGSMAALRKPAFVLPSAPPVFVDRSM